MSDDASKFRKVSWNVSIMYSKKNFQWQQRKAVQMVSNADRFSGDKLERIAKTFPRSKKLFTLGQYLCGDVRRLCRRINTSAAVEEHRGTCLDQDRLWEQSQNRGVVSSSVNRTWLEARQTSLKFDVRWIGKCGEFVVVCSLVNRVQSQSDALLLLECTIQSGL